jgi:hypothetical protein
MSIQLKAIYENGVFRPLEVVKLAEKQEVTVTIDGHGADSTGTGNRALFTLPPDRWQMFCDALDAPPREIPALRKLLTEASLFDGKSISPANAGPA